MAKVLHSFASLVEAHNELVANAVTMSGSQTITGLKNFTGGLKSQGQDVYHKGSTELVTIAGTQTVTGKKTFNESLETKGTFKAEGGIDAPSIPVAVESATAGQGFGGFRYTLTDGGETLNLFTT